MIFNVKYTLCMKRVDHTCYGLFVFITVKVMHEGEYYSPSKPSNAWEHPWV